MFYTNRRCEQFADADEIISRFRKRLIADYFVFFLRIADPL